MSCTDQMIFTRKPNEAIGCRHCLSLKVAFAYWQYFYTSYGSASHSQLVDQFSIGPLSFRVHAWRHCY